MLKSHHNSGIKNGRNTMLVVHNVAALFMHISDVVVSSYLDIMPLFIYICHRLNCFKYIGNLFYFDLYLNHTITVVYRMGDSPGKEMLNYAQWGAVFPPFFTVYPYDIISDVPEMASSCGVL